MSSGKKYERLLSLKEIELAIKQIKDYFEVQLSEALRLQRVTAPFFVASGMGLNDDLTGVERPVSFRVSGAACSVEVVQSLAKWKRFALKRYGFKEGEGLYTDMNAIRPDETLDDIHSFYVDQWDWCKIIAPEERTTKTLFDTVLKIYSCLLNTEAFLAKEYPKIEPILPKDITFITSKELYERFPNDPPKVREDKITKEYGAVFIVGIGGALPDGSLHDKRAPDYDDWSTPRPDGGIGLNGDIILWNPILERAFEISSMGIRVNSEVLKKQLAICHCEDREKLHFHQMLLNNELPQTIGGGIGQSRLCMFMLRCLHIGEVACGVWPTAMQKDCEARGIVLL